MNWQYLMPLSSYLCNVIYTHTHIVNGLVGGDNNIFVMKERQLLSHIWVLRNQVFTEKATYVGENFTSISICYI
jgi:hypothetical protein